MILRTCLCIPTYNNPLTIVTVVQDAINGTQLPILVIDDGSDVPVLDLLKKADLTHALDSKRVRVIRFPANKGKGIALQHAITFFVSEGFTHLFACDGDGQHLITEIPKMLLAAKENPWDLIIGKRKLQASTVPGISKFGRKFSNYWVQFQTGSAIGDSQSGFRIYPLFHLQMLTFRTERFDFEIEVLVKLLWKGAHLREVEVDVYYPPADERVSHFNKFWDNVYISTLNTIFVIVSLLKSQRSPKKNGLAIGLGVFVGATPVYGFHTLIVAAMSFVFRLNFTYLFIGSNISIPPLAPFLIFASLVLGHKVLDIFTVAPPLVWPELNSLKEILVFGKDHLLEWIVGSLALGFILGISSGLITYVISRRLLKSSSQQTWTGRSRGGKFGNGFLKVVIKYIGLDAGYFCLRFITPYFYIFAPQGRRALNEYWSIMDPKKTWLARQIQIVKHFYRFGQILMDRGYQNFHAAQKFDVQSHGFEHIVQAKGKGALLLGAHVGGWDLAAALMETHEYREEVHIVEFLSPELSFQSIRGKNSKAQVKSIDSAAHLSRSGTLPVLEIYQALSHLKTVGMMGDRPIGDRFMLVPFLGRLACFDITPFQIAAATKVEVIFTFGFKGPDRQYLFFAHPPRKYIYSSTLDRDIQCYRWASEFAQALEQHIRIAPDQWFNFFSFWSVPHGHPFLYQEGNHTTI